MQVTPSGNFLYVTASGSPDGYIAGFSVNAGALTSIGPPFSSDGVNPNGLAIDPKGAFLYAANTSSPSIAIFSIDGSGALSPVQNSPLADTYTAPVALTLDAKGAFLYVANQGSSNVAVYSISSTTGLPTVLTNSTTTGAFFTEGSPSFVAPDPGGQYLFVGNQGTSAGIQSFSVSSGNLTSLFKYNVGNTPSSIVVLQ
jgi:6-phosphogluconolactonase (cycloisomerase 2 family)